MREVVSLDGVWSFALDPHDQGATDHWETRHLEGQIQVPGSWEEQGYGEPPARENLGGWTKTRAYTGSAWYARELRMPSSWRAGRTELIIAGAHWRTSVWLDGHEVGTNDSLVCEHVFDLTPFVRPGTSQHLAIRVDNRLFLPLEESHIHSEHTATNWGGMTGGVWLVHYPSPSIRSIRVTPDIAGRRASFDLEIEAPSGTDGLSIDLSVAPATAPGDEIARAAARLDHASDACHAYVSIQLGPAARFWSDRDPFLYRVRARLVRGAEVVDEIEQRFGLREVRVDGRTLLLNGRPVFLRGYVDCCIFPRTGYPVWDVAEYRRQFQIARAHGFNHVRLHSWTPPPPFWQAADEIGMLVQTELPHWSRFFRQSEVAPPVEVADFLWKELRRVIARLNAHPSWIMLSLGNELIGPDGHPELNRMVAAARALDPTRLYTDNTGFGELPSPGRDVDYFVQSCNWHPPLEINRAATPDSREDFGVLPALSSKPVIGHEHGQFTMYVRPSEEAKYTGLLRPTWLRSTLATLAAKGLEGRVDEFLRASGVHLVRALKENLERARRTPGLAGIQLLDLRDFPGQGHATTGILDVFWESKGVIDPATFARFNGERVLLMRSSGRTVWSGEQICVDLELSNFGAEDVSPSTLIWELRAGDRVQAAATLSTEQAPVGAISRLGRLRIPTPVGEATAWTLSVRLETPEGPLCNEWEFWSFPYPQANTALSDVCCAIPALRSALAGARFDRQPLAGTRLMVTDRLSRQLVQYLWDGGRVWLMVRPGQACDGVETRYLPPFWSYLWFSGRTGTTMGMLIRSHPSLGHFPHDGFSNWQWYYLVDGAVAVSLDSVRQVSPIVEVIDNFNRARRLAYAFEARVGRGSLFVSTWKLFDPTVVQRPEGRFLCAEVLDYLRSDSFRPDAALTLGDVLSLFGLE